MGAMGAMSPSDAVPAAGPVERFDPTSGYVVGYTTLVAIALLEVYIAVTDPSMNGLRIALGAVFLGVLVWATQIRPRAVAYADTLLLKNIVGDVEVPLALVDNVVLATTLTVYAEDERFVCVGIGTTRRGRKRETSLPGQPVRRGRGHQAAMTAESFVPHRIQELAAEARRRGTQPGGVRRRTSVPVLVAIAVTGLAFVVSLLL